MAQYGQESALRRPLLIAAGVLFVIVAVVYGIRLLAGGGPPPEELARLALEAETVEQREQAASQLAGVDGAEVLEHLRRVATESQDAGVRAVCILEIGDRRDYESMDLLLAALDDESPLVRARAATAAGQIIGREYRYEFNAPAPQRKRTVDDIKACWEQMKGSEPWMKKLKEIRDQQLANEKGGE